LAVFFSGGIICWQIVSWFLAPETGTGNRHQIMVSVSST